ncbi:uncharacterized protein LOC108681812 [Hyalella azteca]|uniref:Uncharacterized protein LOC108681812 n=1 Tax=Hyalella azteca TaxID=294128 RepID=A0A8B7PLV2_HYAAZ|nr:uncharacterized protein LOC108681812 [Hyalella azteca]
MELVNEEDVKELVKEELSKLGILDSPVLTDIKKQGYGAKLLGRTGVAPANKNVKNKKKEHDLSKESPVAPKHDGFRNNPKSPFSKNRNSTKKKNMVLQNKVFGVGLSQSPQCKASLPDGNCVQVPQFLVDSCNVLRKHITLEGIFRKAGSSSRQNEIKRLVDSGAGLPSNIHAVDAACLIKQFFRCLPQPILETSVHTRMLRCLLTLEEGEPRVAGLVLCSLLLPSPSQHCLVYFLNFLNEIVQESSSNRMDAYNLAVVLSPNLLPMTLSHPTLTTNPTNNPTGCRKSKFDASAITEDNIIAANIDIMQELIKHQHRMCRVHVDVWSSLLQEQQLRASAPNEAQDATDGPRVAIAALPKNKKRRSASIHRLMSGLRRVVGAQAAAALPEHLPINTNSPHPLQQHRITRHTSSPPPHSRSTSLAPTNRHPYRLPAVSSPPHLSIAGRVQIASSPLRSPSRLPIVPSPVLLFSPSHAKPSLHPLGDGIPLRLRSPGKRKSSVLLSSGEIHDEDLPKKKARLGAAPMERSGTARLSYAAAVAASPKMPPPQVQPATAVVKVRRSATTRESSSGIRRSSFARHPSLGVFIEPSLSSSKKCSPRQRRSLNSNLGEMLVGIGEKWIVKSDKMIEPKPKKKPTLVLYPYASDETPIASSAPITSQRCLADETKIKGVETNIEVMSGEIQPLLLYKSKSEIISRSSEQQSVSRTPLKVSKAEDHVKFQTTPSIDSSMKFTAATPNRDQLEIPATPVSEGFTPRQSSGRCSKRARRKARNARLALQSELDGESDTPSRPSPYVEPAETKQTSRDSPVVVEPPARGGSDLVTLESQYETIKGAVETLEKQMDDAAFDELKRSLFGDEEITSIASLNHNEIIQSAYDRMKKESSLLGISPSENLSRRLDRELKIRRRRSGENCVVRSPSARKIGTIRRRSKELVVKSQQGCTSVEVPTDLKGARTPRLKEALLKSPLSHSLKRGRPNSVRCGLPFVVRPMEADVSVVKPRKDTPPLSTQSTLVNANVEPSTPNLSGNPEELQYKLSPGNMDDHSLPSVMPGVTLNELSSVEMENEHWVTASDFLEEVESQICNETSESGTPLGKQKDGNRPSIAALKKQKKVTANVQLFNQLGCNTQQRRQSRVCATPMGACPALPRPAVSERRQQNSLSQQRSRPRASLTPRHFANCSASRRPRMVAVVSPLKENFVNVTHVTAMPSGNFEQSVFKTPQRPPPATPKRPKGHVSITHLSLESPGRVERQSSF